LEQRLDQPVRGVGHLRAVHEALRGREGMAAFRHLRLDAECAARPAGRRRMPGRARALCDALRALRLMWTAPLAVDLLPANNTAPKQLSGSSMAVEIRPSQALRLLHEVSHALVTDGEPDLSARQLDVLFTIYLEPPPHTVRGLAAKLGV